jgi:hypothetical protein
MNTDTTHQQLDEIALANLAAWVPVLKLYRCRPTRGGYEAVATWRESTTKRDKRVRNRNLKIMPNGIRDFGAGRGYTPIDLVMATLKCDRDAAFVFLLDISTPAVVVAPEPEPISRLTHSYSNSRVKGPKTPETSGTPTAGPVADAGRQEYCRWAPAAEIQGAELASATDEKEHLTRTLCSASASGRAVDAVTIAASLLAERFLLPNGWCNLEYKPKGDYFVTKIGGRRVHLTDNEMSLFVSKACERHGRCWCGTAEVYRTLAWMCYRGADRDWIDPYSEVRPEARPGADGAFPSSSTSHADSNGKDHPGTE